MSAQIITHPLSYEETIHKLVELIEPLRGEIVYPESDGEPMAETDIHRDQMVDAVIHPLRELLRGRAYVSGNLLFYYQKGNPRASVAPDAFVVFGIPEGRRRTYKLWEEGKTPEVVFELTSESTRSNDMGDKRLLYEALGVREYFLFDPLSEYLKPPLRGFRLVEGYYSPLMPETLPDGNLALFSESLGLRLETSEQGLRFWNPATEEYLLTSPEETQARRAAELRAVRETEARYQAETRAVNEIEARRQAETRATEEAEARRQAEAEILRLRALLEQRGINKDE